jgi:hypothetical protein
MRVFVHIGHLFLTTAALTLLSCAGPSASAPTGGAAPAVASAPATPAESVPAARANLGGRRCHDAVCTCRSRGSGDDGETPPPDAGHKRFEIRLGAGGGPAALTSPTLGELQAGPDETCFYVDVVPGTTHEVTFLAKERRPEEGVSPELEIAEFGPKGPWWYDVLVVKCDSGPGGHCNRDAADAWSAEVKTRKRGRVDPCGSSVIKNLKWDTTGGTGYREAGLFADFKVTFTMEVKKFPTQFQPGSTECVPK